METKPKGRVYDIAWADGKRQRLEGVTQVLVSRDNPTIVSFYAPLDGGGYAGRLLRSVVMGPASVVDIREVDDTVSMSPKAPTTTNKRNSHHVRRKEGHGQAES